MEDEIKKAIALLDSAGYGIVKRIGQTQIQLVRKRKLEEDAFWKYQINKYTKNYSPEDGEEVETVVLELQDIKWKKERRI